MVMNGVGADCLPNHQRRARSSGVGMVGVWEATDRMELCWALGMRSLSVMVCGAGGG